MSRIRRAAICGFTACTVFWSAPAKAQTVAGFSIPVHGTFVAGGAIHDVEKISLPASGTPSFAFNFVLPPDYDANSEVTVVLYVSAAAGLPCSVRLTPVRLTRARGGAQTFTSFTGLTAPNEIINFDTPNKIRLRNFRINPSGIGSIADQKKGDSFILQFARYPDGGSDTCFSNLFVHAINVRYTVP